jgi:hypothetical protein
MKSQRNPRVLCMLALAVACAASSQGAFAQARTLAAALSRGTVSGVFNLRYEEVNEDNTLQTASALTLRSAIKFTTAQLDGFTGVAELEDVRIVGGMGDYSVPQTAYKTGLYSTIADPAVTELNQGYLQYNDGRYTVKLGRQDIRYDNQRFVGAVAWRQDYQSFDALTFNYKNEAALSVDYNYIGKRNRIFAQAADIDSKDHLLHLTYPTPIGSLVAYGYLIRDDIVLTNRLDTYGLRLTGAKHLGSVDTTYTLEYASQRNIRGAANYTADYYTVEGGATLGPVTTKLGYEFLGSDRGLYGFATPLATLHIFQGWADEFLTTPAQGIKDSYISLSGAVAGGTLTFAYHDYKADEKTALISSLGKESNIQWTLPILNNYTFGVKYADYQQGDIAAKANKGIFWTWFTITF